MDRERLDNWCEKALLGLVLTILVFGPLALGGARAWEFLVLQGLTLCVMLVWTLRLWVNPRPKLLWPPICWAVIAFTIYAVVRYYQADIEFVARKELLRVLIYAFLFLAIINNLHRQETTQIITLTLIFLGMAISVYAVCQFVTKSHHIWWVENSNYPGRAGGTFIYPNHLAGFLEMLIPLGLCQVMVGRLSHLAKVFLGYAVVVMLAGVAVTLSRGGWIVTGVILVMPCFVLLFHRDYRMKALLLLGVLVLVGIFLIPQAEAVQQRLRKAFSGGGLDDSRFSIWWSTIQMWRDHFWYGVGPGHFDYRFSQYRLPDLQLHAGFAHNDYLNTLADWGVVGMTLVAATLVLLYWGIFRSWKFVRGAQDDFARKKSGKLAFLVGASISVLAVLMHSMLDFILQMPANAILAVTLMALLSSQWRFATDRYWFSAGITSKCLVTLVLLAGIGWMGRAEIRGAQEFALLRQVDKTRVFSYARIAALEKVYALDPMNFEVTFALAECYKLKSFNSESDDPNALARKAIAWYERGMKLNPYESLNWLRCAMCMDWIGMDENGVRIDSSKYYLHANELDPNGYYTTGNIGWHFVQIGDYAAARTWLERCQRLEWSSRNELAKTYLPIVERRMAEAAEDPRKKMGSAKPELPP